MMLEAKDFPSVLCQCLPNTLLFHEHVTPLTEIHLLPPPLTPFSSSVTAAPGQQGRPAKYGSELLPREQKITDFLSTLFPLSSGTGG